MQKASGIVKFYNPLKGFGFITDRDTSKDIFVHISAIEAAGLKYIGEGQRVSFDTETNPRNGKMSAVNISVLNTEIYDKEFINDINFDFDFGSIGIKEERKYSFVIARSLDSFFSENINLLDKISGEDFEDLCYWVLTKENFIVEKAGSYRTPDGGVDMIARFKHEGNFSMIFAVQCKTSKHHITAEPIRALNGVLSKFGADAGIFMTNSVLTSPATKELVTDFTRIKLRDYNNIKNALKNILRHKQG